LQIDLNPALASPLLSVMNFLNEVTLEFPDAISFAPGRPAESFFDVAGALTKLESFVAYRSRQTGQPPAAIRTGLGQYGKTNGIINDLIARYLATDERIDAAADAIMVTSGAQEAMSILLQGLFAPDRDVLLVSEPNYIGMTSAARVLGIEIEPIPVDPDGVQLGALRDAIERVRRRGRCPKAFYDIPDFHNPLGTALAIERRHELLRIAADTGVLVIEDNPYGMFAYDAARLPTLKSLDRDGSVIYIGTFSKTLFPALRIGYLVADQPVAAGPERTWPLAAELSKVKSITSVNTSGILQAIVGGILIESECSLEARIADKIAYCKGNRDHMLIALERCFGAGTPFGGALTWNRPRGGYFLTVETPLVWTEQAVRTCARDFGVIVCPMVFFSQQPGRERQIRLSFSYVSAEEIDGGIERLRAFLARGVT